MCAAALSLCHCRGLSPCCDSDWAPRDSPAHLTHSLTHPLGAESVPSIHSCTHSFSRRVRVSLSLGPLSPPCWVFPAHVDDERREDRSSSTAVLRTSPSPRLTTQSGMDGIAHLNGDCILMDDRRVLGSVACLPAWDAGWTERTNLRFPDRVEREKSHARFFDGEAGHSISACCTTRMSRRPFHCNIVYFRTIGL